MDRKEQMRTQRTFTSRPSAFGDREAANGPTCHHEGARHIRLFIPYADANVIRMRLAASTDGAYVSPIYRLPGDGWGWTMCPTCGQAQ